MWFTCTNFYLQYLELYDVLFLWDPMIINDPDLPEVHNLYNSKAVIS